MLSLPFIATMALVPIVLENSVVLDKKATAPLLKKAVVAYIMATASICDPMALKFFLYRL